MRICAKCGLEKETVRCRPCRNAARRRADAENPERTKARRAKTYADPEQREKALARARAWATKNPERRRVIKKRYAEAERGRQVGRVGSIAARARRRAAPGGFSAEDIENLLVDQFWTCAYCPADISGGRHTVDHITPLSKGGTNWLRNICLACRPCNTKKNARTPDEWRAELIA